MNPAKKVNESILLLPILTTYENKLLLECAGNIVNNLDKKIKKSRSLNEISKLHIHRKVVTNVINKFLDSRSV